jgi:uncharacterized protein with PIN domain
MNENNPLQQYFRQPAIYVTLPSQGKFYATDALIMPPTGELPVYPMTAIDEITYRTPDALFNGQSTVNVLQSCVPNIKNGWAIPAMDIDALLIAIRIASYGHNMEFGTVCPKCNHSAEHTLDLRTALDSIRAGDYTSSLNSGDMEIFFRPMTYQNLNDNNKLQYTNQKALQNIPTTDASDDDKITALGAALKKITEITVSALAQSISAVKTPTALVTEPKFIEELLQNCDKTLFGQIRDRIIELKSAAEMQPLHMVCSECNHNYEQTVTLDMSSFFEPAS